MAGKHTDKHPVRFGAVQETLFITLAARARETQRKHPGLRDPRAVELLSRSTTTAPLRLPVPRPLADPLAGKAMNLTLFRASSPAAGGPDATARAAGTA
jgi:O-methyltransferase involved in polyketide biosynthesis